MSNGNGRLRGVLACAALPVLLVLLVLLTGCDVLGGLSRRQGEGEPYIQHVGSGVIDMSLYAGAGRSAYAVFTTGYADRIAPTARRDSAAGARAASPRAHSVAEAASEERRARFKASLAAYTPALPRRLSASGGEPAADVKDVSSGSFKVLVNFGTDAVPDYGVALVPSTCRYASGPVDLGGRTRSLSVWVADDSWTVGGSKVNLVTPAMVEALALQFFGAASDRASSIYAWVTAMLGDEWGPGGSFTYGGVSYPAIGATNNVTILLSDIYERNAQNGGVVGYYYSGDIIPGQADANERVMFAIDSVMYANPDDSGRARSDPLFVDDGWTADDYWPMEIFSTLAHEFQHMIHFYQKAVVAGADTSYEPTWVDELCSMQVEDLLADKMGVQGPRGVAPSEGGAGDPGNTAGRLPGYIFYPDISLEVWGAVDTLGSYSAAYAFGAYLTRNYGGADFVRRVVQSAYPDERSVVSAAESASGRAESMVGLLARWGVAALLSGRTDAPEGYRYNSGGFFTSSVGGAEYRLGSINMYNYLVPDGVDSDGDGLGDTDLTAPYAYAPADIGDLYGGAYSNAFMDLGDPAIRNNQDWTLRVPPGMTATIVID